MRYLLAVDSTEPAQAASDFLLKLLKKGDVVFIVHVQAELGFGEALIGNREELIAQRAKDAEALERELLEKYKGAIGLGVEVRFDTYHGDVKELLLEKAKERQVEILVVGHRGIGLIQRVITSGSVSEHLVKNAPCSVLIV